MAFNTNICVLFKKFMLVDVTFEYLTNVGNFLLGIQQRNNTSCSVSSCTDAMCPACQLLSFTPATFINLLRKPSTLDINFYVQYYALLYIYSRIDPNLPPNEKFFQTRITGFPIARWGNKISSPLYEILKLLPRSK